MNYLIKHIVIFFAFGILGNIPSRAQATFSGERLREAVISYTQKMVSEDAEILVSQKISDQLFKESGVTAKCFGSKESLKGVSNVAVEFSANGRIIHRIQIPIQVKIYREVPVTTSTISSNSLISRQNITLEKRDVTAYSENELITESEILGSTAKRTIPKGSIITRLSVAEKNAVRRGMPAVIVVQAGNVIIRTRGSVLNDAVVGEAVRVMREGTNTMLTGILQDNQTVFIRNSSLSSSESE